MNTIIKKICPSIFIFFSLLAIYCLSHRLSQIQPEIQQEEYLYLAKNRRIKQFAFGFEGEYAVWLWIQSQISLHRKIFEGALFTKMPDIYDTITDLDPYFQDVYSKGPWYLNIACENPMPGILLLEKGTKKIPQAWIWLLKGQMYRLQRWELEKKQIMTRKEALEKAFFSFQKAILLHPDKEILERLESFLKNPGGTLDTIAWVKLYHQSMENPLLSCIFLKNFHIHIIRIHLEYLQYHIIEFKKKFQRWPLRLEELPVPCPREPEEIEAARIAKEIYHMSYKSKQDKKLLFQCLLHSIQKKFSHPYNYDCNTGKVVSFFYKKNRERK